MNLAEKTEAQVSMSAINSDFPFESKYIEVLGSKMHYVDEGAGQTILFLHGNPTSTYLWRNVIPHLSDTARCIAVDLIGMGKSDKPEIEYRFVDHQKYLVAFIEKMQLKDITLVIHDWGSALGFDYAATHEDNVRGIAFMESILMPLTWEAIPEQARNHFRQFRTAGVGERLIMEQNMFVEQFLPSVILRDLSEEELNFYKAPYPTVESRKPVWRWPNEIPIDGTPADVHEIVVNYNQWLQKSNTPKLMLFAEPGLAVTEEVVEWARQKIKNLNEANIGPGLHFVQEDNPHGIGKAISNWLKSIS